MYTIEQITGVKLQEMQYRLGYGYYHKPKVVEKIKNIVRHITFKILNPKKINYIRELYDAWDWRCGKYGYTAYFKIYGLKFRISDHENRTSGYYMNKIIDINTDEELVYNEIITKIIKIENGKRKKN